MKIALLNPWVNAAENQLVPALAQVARRLGHEVVECKTSAEILEQRPDLVLSMSRTQPKLTDTPTYGLVFDPLDIVLERREYLYNLLSFDGALTIFDTLKDALTDLAASAGRDLPIGYFYPTTTVARWDDALDLSSARLAYFGINWDRRRETLFRTLADRPWMEIYGPEPGWRFLGGRAYQGSVPFDGRSVLERYRAAGAGLCIFSESHVSDNLVSSRLFEICAAGAVVITARVPWIEEQFGDAVLYFDQHAPDAAMAGAIDRHMAWIRAQPDAARALAGRSHAIFAERFSLERLFPRLLDLHAAVGQATAGDRSQASVSAVVLTDSAAPEPLRRTLDSIARQQAGPIEIVIAAPSGREADRLRDWAAGAYAGQRIVVAGAAGRTPPSPLWEALSACTGQYVSVIRAGDQWMSNHVSSVLDCFGRSGSDVVASGAIVEHTTAFSTRGGNRDTRRLLHLAQLMASGDVVGAALALPSHAVMFRRTLLTAELLAAPPTSGLDEAHLLLRLLQRAWPACSYRATAVRYAANDPFLGDEAARARAVARLRLRFAVSAFPAPPEPPEFEALQVAVEQRETRRRTDDRRTVHGDGVSEYRVPAAFERLVGPEACWSPVDVPLLADDVEVAGEPAAGSRPLGLPLTVRSPAAPWANLLVWRGRLPEDRPYVVRVTGRVAEGTVAFGVWNVGGHAAYRTFVHAGTSVVVVDLPIYRPAEVGEIVVQAGRQAHPATVTVDAVQFFAAPQPTPTPIGLALRAENDALRADLAAAGHERDLAQAALRESERTVATMAGSRIWRIGRAYWRLLALARRVRRTAGRRP